MISINVSRTFSRAGLANIRGIKISPISISPLFSIRQLSVTKPATSEANNEQVKTKEKTASLTQAVDENKDYKSSRDTNTEKRPNSNFDLNSIFLLSIPVTTHRSFIYCHHNAGLLSKDQLEAVSWLSKTEKKLVGLAEKAWHKLLASELTINKKIVALVSKLLGSIPYNENCLRSFPSKEAMVREINDRHSKDLPRAVFTSELAQTRISVDQLKPIPVYHPFVQSPHVILSQMHRFKTELLSHHRKWAILCAIGIPISLPVALVPVAPNVPGFYLAYRLYCHLQALRGAKNLGFLLETDSASPDEKNSASSHLFFKHHADLDGAFAHIKPQSEAHEYMLLDSETVDKLVDITGLPEIKEDLYRAFKQERKRLDKLAQKSD